MINFPIIERLDVFDYGLYPGRTDEPGLHVEFSPGLTLVLGTNGLGKTTLISIMYRLLTGPFDIPGLKDRAQLGNVQLAAVAVPPKVRSTFAHRVTDNAANARARLAFRLGESSLVVERRLSDLRLTHFSVDGVEPPLHDENSFQPEIVRLVGLWAFGDWILLLRHLTFYFEDRRALVWDPSAQRQLFRFLFLPPATAGAWTRDEREILELDSRVRNLNAALFREEQVLSSNEAKNEDVPNVREELKTLGDLQRIDHDRAESLESILMDLDSAREHARRRLLTAQEERESRYRDAERSRLLAIAARFPNRSEAARFLIAQLLTESECMVCGHEAAEAAAVFGERLAAGQCVVCASDLASEDAIVSAPQLADARVAAASAALAEIEVELSGAQQQYDLATREYDNRSHDIGRVRAALHDRSTRIDSLLSQLPPEEVDLHEVRKELALLKARVSSMRTDLASKRRVFSDFVSSVSLEIVKLADAIKQAFNDFARGFLLEDCQLVWSPQKAKIGETGEPVDFPAFGLEMTGADFVTPVRRQGPEQVSESQREFIDLAFRMALIAAGGSEGSGTLVIDAPESSLDAVFARRAAAVLVRFAGRTPLNRLVVTSNLVEGQLIPQLIAEGIPIPEERSSRILDLFEIATPTAAVRELKGEYEEIRDRLLAWSADGR